MYDLKGLRVDDLLHHIHLVLLESRLSPRAPGACPPRPGCRSVWPCPPGGIAAVGRSVYSPSHHRCIATLFALTLDPRSPKSLCMASHLRATFAFGSSFPRRTRRRRSSVLATPSGSSCPRSKCRARYDKWGVEGP